MDKKYNRTLVLDSSYMPRGVINSMRAFIVIYKGNATVLENHPCNFKLYNPELIIPKPSVIQVPKYVRGPNHNVSLGRDNIFKRDGYKCVYCGSTNKRDLTLDHVIPQTNGGENSWKNLVTACKKCNGDKGDLSLEEWGKSIPPPKKPHYLMLLKSVNYMPEEWKKYLFM